MSDLGLIIVSYNVSDLLGECLRSVFASGGVTAHVAVVDNASEDGSATMVKQRFPQATVIESPTNGGYAYANNLGLRLLQELPDPPHYVLLLNPDTVVPADGLRRMLDYMEARPDVGVAGPKLVLRDGSLDLACRRSFPSPYVSFCRIAGLSKLFPRSRLFGRYNLTYLDPDREAEVDSVVGAFMMVKWKAFQDAGLLDESFFLYGEDLDWAYRMKEHGWRVMYNPALKVLHHKGESSRRNSKRATSEFYRAMLIFYHKHYARNTFPLLGAAIVLGIHLRSALARASSLLRPASIKGG